MAIEFNKLINAIVPSALERTLQHMVEEYHSIKMQLENKDTQSFYFKQAIDSKIKRLESLHNDFEKVRTRFNESSKDKLNEKYLEVKGHKERYDKKGFSNMIDRMAYASICSDLEYFKQLVDLKSKVDMLMPIEFYSDGKKLNEKE